MFTPSIVPAADETGYIVADDFGSKLGRVYRETDSAQCDRETALQDLQTGQYQYNDPVRVVAFNTAEGWSRDVSREFAEELQRRADLVMQESTVVPPRFEQLKHGDSQIEWFALQLHFAASHSPDFEQIVDQACHVFDLPAKNGTDVVEYVRVLTCHLQ